jgi:enoyl-CoA hydratase/carnithine racemase
VYGTMPSELAQDGSDELQQQIDDLQSPDHVAHPRGWASIETFTVLHGRGGTRTGIVIGRLDDGGGRFLATVAPEDDHLLYLLQRSEQPVGERIYATSHGWGNRVTLSKELSAALYERSTPTLRDDYEFVKVHREGHLLEISISRPDVRNCLHPPAHEELDGIFDAFFADSDLWVAIITGEGSKAFCAGNDLVYSTTSGPLYIPLNGFAGLSSRKHMHKPVIAAVNGFAMGGGFEVALACHLVVADASATFALSEVKVGLVAGAGGVIRLPRTIPPKIANDLILTGRRIDAEKAHQLGIVSRIAPPGRALTVARDLAAEILEGSPTSVRLSLKLMEQTQGIADTVEAVVHPNDLVDELMTSADAFEGMTAFAQKRRPEWKNR